MGDNYIINEDGTITRKNLQSSNKREHSSNNTGNTGIIILVICIVLGIVIAAIIMAVNSDREENSYAEPEKDVSEVVSDNDYTNDENDSYVEEVTVEATYLSLSKNNVTFDSDGGSIDIDIETDGEWEIGTSTADWGHLSKHSSSVTLTVDRYSGGEDRTDWFTIKAGDYEKRIEITQQANNEPSANIERVWIDHNEYMNGEKGMLIHTKINVEHLEGKTIYVYVYFYQADNTTPLHDPYGNDLYFYGTGNVNIKHKSGHFDDLKIFVPYSGLNMAPGTSDSFSFDISVKYGEEQLDRNINNSFTFTSGY